MKSVISIFLICYFSLAAMVPRMDMDRLQQIPDLIVHFMEHQNAQGVDGSTVVVDFISQHYSGNNTEPTDGHNLPFHRHDCNVIASLFASFVGLTSQIVYEPPFLTYINIYSFHLTPHQLPDIWQPPRA